MLRDSLRPVRDLFNKMSTKQRIRLFVGIVIYALLLGGIISLAPWIEFWPKFGIFVLGLIFTACFIYTCVNFHSKNMDEDQVETEHDGVSIHIPPMPKRQPSAGTARLSMELEPIKLSTFASRRITSQQPILKNSQPILEQRISKAELFVQLEKRRPTGRTVKRIWSKKPVQVLEPRKTIWAEIFWCSATITCFVYVIWLLFISGQEVERVAVTALLIFTGIFVVVSVIKIYIKWAYWHFWRLLLFRANEEEGVDAKVVIIDKPFLIPGGSVPSVDLRILRLVSSSTARTIEDERSLESILAGWLGVEWLLLDTYGQGDARFNWMGPFRNAPTLVAIFDHERRKARLEDQ
ncbi:MAG TPA: hypothetical protein VF281_00565 [Candidatus Saccharimonadales bacterium]